MTDKAIKYTVTADANPFAAGMERVGQVLGGLQAKTLGMGRDFGNVTAGMSANMAKVAASVSGEVAGMGGHFSALLGNLSATKVGMLALVGVAAGLAASKAVGATARMTEEAMDLARVLGSTTNEAQRWKIALAGSAAEQEDLTAAAKGMTRQLKENEAGMNALGLQTRDASGNFRPLNDMLLDGIELMNRHKEGADRALAGQQLFGRGIDTASKLLMVNKTTMAEATSIVDELNLEVGANAVAAWTEYDAATDRADFSVKGLIKTVGAVLMPVMTDLINLFNAVMPGAIVVAKGALGGLATAFHLFKNGVVVVWEVINAMVVSVAEPIRALAEALVLAASGDLAGAGDAIKNIGRVISNAWSTAMDSMADSSQRTRDRIAAIWSKDTAAGAGEGVRGTDSYTPPPGAPGKTAGGAGGGKAGGAQPVDPGFMQYYELALAEERRLAAEKDALREYTKEQERGFWQNLLENADLAGKDRVAISRKVADIELQILREAAQTQRASDLEEIKERQARALNAVAMAQLEARGQLEAGALTKEEMLVQEAAFEEQRTAIQRAALEARRALIDVSRDPVAYQQISNEIEELERQHQLKLGQIRLQQKSDGSMFDNIWRSAEQTAARAMDGIITRTQTLRQSMASIWASIRQSVVGEMVKMVAARVAAFAKERLIALAGIGTSAVKAGAGAAESQASIPYVGPALAIAAMGAMIATVGGLSSKVPSAAGGWSIPTGLNPLTQLHEEEMVLPKDIANPMREMAAGGGSGGPIVINATGGDFIHKRDLADLLRQMKRDFRFV
jgi:hypothetical protein